VKNLNVYYTEKIQILRRRYIKLYIFYKKNIKMVILTMINYKTCDLVHEIMITSWNTNRKKLKSLILINYKKK
jgi:hypothetical protein